MMRMEFILFFTNILRLIFFLLRTFCFYQCKYVDSAYRYKCAIFCTQVLFLIKRKHHFWLTSTAKVQENK